ncbi:hypothetical protein TELCIR_16498 [Teladorsagia circumcincta]|uniref:Uncharacterized protein n=1 Tax=Teladorsagia circumcincta TaxID=45464 RepID=A0A2G9TVB5_TELCI|nr:hypothetical protein TELCIR_16498 [Teladorsagia circumcincta]
MLDATLDGMSKGGIHDHIGKGFHRYSVDEEWHVPHFEKMLYDQSQLLSVYADCSRIFGDKFNAVVKDIADYMEGCLSHKLLKRVVSTGALLKLMDWARVIKRETEDVVKEINAKLVYTLLSKAGGFYAAEDADSFPTANSNKKQEGAFCVWEMSEVNELLKDLKFGDKDAVNLFCRYYDIHEKGNVGRFKDPHGELQRKNVLRMKQSHDEFAEEFGLPSEVLSAGIEEAKLILAEARSKRPAPHLDSKMVCSWQGLAITGFVKASLALARQDYLERAKKTVEFVKRYLMDENGQLLRAAYRGDDGNVETT